MPKIKRDIYGLTARQQKCLEFIRREIEKNGVAPSYREIQVGIGFNSISGVHQVIHGLRDRGHVDFKKGQARSLRVTGAPIPLKDAIDCVLKSGLLSGDAEGELRGILGCTEFREVSP